MTNISTTLEEDKDINIFMTKNSCTVKIPNA